jgi:hypothetical protein
MSNNIYKYRKYKEKYLNLYKKIHGGIRLTIPDGLHTATKLVYVYKDPRNSTNNFYVFSLGNTPYFQIIKMSSDGLLRKSYYVTRNYLERSDDSIINNHINGNRLDHNRLDGDILTGVNRDGFDDNILYIDYFNIMDSIDVTSRTIIRNAYQIDGTIIRFSQEFSSFIIYRLISDSNMNIYRIQSTSSISDTIYYIDRDYYMDRNVTDIEADILNNRLSTNILTLTERQEAPPTPAPPVQLARSVALAPTPAPPVQATKLCPVCNDTVHFVKMFNNNTNRCNLCSDIPDNIFLSYCDHMYCEKCFEDPYIKKINLTIKDPLKLCDDHNISNINKCNNVIDCPSCNSKGIQFIFDLKYEDTCKLCFKYTKGSMIGCCGHSICLHCFIGIKRSKDIDFRRI